MAVRDLPKVQVRVRFPSPAQNIFAGIAQQGKSASLVKRRSRVQIPLPAQKFYEKRD